MLLTPAPTLHWRSFGEGEASLVMLHCALGHGGLMEPLAKRLGRPALAPDLPAHGKSPARDGAQDFQAQCLDAVVQGLPGGPLDIVGHSFGATIALRLAIEHPDRVRRLVLIEPVFFAAAQDAPDYAALTDWARDFAALYEAGKIEDAARAFTAVWGGGTPWEALPDAQRAAFVNGIHVIPASDGALFHDNAQLLSRGRMEAVTAPVLLLDGAASPPVIDAIQTALAARLPHTRRETIRGSGHMLPLTHVSAVAHAIRGFLD